MSSPRTQSLNVSATRRCRINFDRRMDCERGFPGTGRSLGRRSTWRTPECWCRTRSLSSIQQIEKTIAIIEPHPRLESAAFGVPPKLITFPTFGPAQVNPQGGFDYLTHGGALIGRPAFELPENLIANLQCDPHA